MKITGFLCVIVIVIAAASAIDLASAVTVSACQHRCAPMTDKMSVHCHDLRYTRTQLIECGKNWCAGFGLQLAPPQLQLLTDLGIVRKKTRRGTRGGRRRQRHIPVLVSSRESELHHKASNTEKTARKNLIQVTINRKQNISKQLHVLYFNAQSCRNKAIELSEVIQESKADLVFITETWFKEAGDEVLMQELTPPGFSLRSFHRQAGNGGGLAVLFRDSLCTNIKIFKPNHDSKSFEVCEVRAWCNSQVFTLTCIYRPPPSRKNQFTVSQFMAEIFKLSDDLANRSPKSVILGDFNLHFDSCTDPNVASLKAMFPTLNLSQLVNQPTHRRGHILDWLVVSEEAGVCQVTVEDKLSSDHFVISFNLNFNKPDPVKRVVTSRDMKKINIAAFKDDVKALCFDSQDLVSSYNNKLQQVLDQHAPLNTRTVTDRPSAPWLTSDVLRARRLRRQAERTWRKSKLVIHRQIFTHHRKTVNDLIIETRRDFISQKITLSTNGKELHRVTGQLLGKAKDKSLPNSIPLNDLPNAFAEFFDSKIQTLRDELDIQCTCQPDFSLFSGSHFSHFTPVTQDTVKEIISKSSPKSCSLDPIPAELLRDCLGELIPTITDIINDSLMSGQVPSPFKDAIVTPLLKKKSLDCNILKNYRPISNLPFLSKILEKVVLRQLSSHLISSDMMEPFQSAYRTNHSTETALLRITHDLLTACDNGSVSILALLDLSAAFDTLDHGILLHRLQNSFGISGKVLEWFHSYLSGRSQTVLVNGRSSKKVELKYGVPQGSVLGPVLFTIYMQPLSKVISHHDALYHMFADDTQLQNSSTPKQFPDLVHSIETCVESVKDWMIKNKLKMNDDKTEIMPVGTPAILKSVANTSSLRLSDISIPFSYKVRNLGVVLDSRLTMENHINAVCKSVFLEIRRISHIRKYISVSASKTLMSAFVLSRLDYCNSLLAGLPDVKLQRLQRMQNNAARLVLRKRKRDHITPLLRSLHWLPVPARIEYKIATLCYQCTHHAAPEYLSELIHIYQPARTLRSTDAGHLLVPRIKLNQYGKRSFSHVAPTIWNCLPKSTRDAPTLSSFKSQLKTFLYKKYLGDY